MKHTRRQFVVMSLLVLAGCAGNGVQVKTLHDVATPEVVVTEAELVWPTLISAIDNYRLYLEHEDNTLYRREALKRLAELELERAELLNQATSAEQRDEGLASLESSIDHYNDYLQQYPEHENNDVILYQLAKAYSAHGDTEKLLDTLTAIYQQYPETHYLEEVQFRRAEILFMLGDFYSAEQAYLTIVERDENSRFFEKAQYKLAWAQFKQERYLEALDNFITILDRKEAEGKLLEARIAEAVSTSEASFIHDVLRVVSLGLSYTEGEKTIQRYAYDNNRRYQPLLYRQLGELYLKTERMLDAATVFLAYSTAYPENNLAPEFHTMAINAYNAGGFGKLVLSSKQDYVNKYDIGTPYWNSHGEATRLGIVDDLSANLHELATYYHSVAQKSRRKNDYIVASQWYRRYMTSFPEDPVIAQINYLLAETYYDAGNYQAALSEYEKTAYDYAPHDKSAEAGYAAILTYNILIKNLDSGVAAEYREQLLSRALENSIRFSFTFPDSSYAPAVISKTADTLFNNKSYARAAEFASKNMWLINLDDKSHIKSIQLVYAHSMFELKDYVAAEAGYADALLQLQQQDKVYKEVSERLAASIYLQAQQYQNSEQYEMAALNYMRAANSVPASSLVATAKYDAAAMYIELAKWFTAINVLEDFRLQFPENAKYSQGVTEKLALCYEKARMYDKAATEIHKLALIAKDPEEKRLLLWQAAETFQRAGNMAQANMIYIDYIKVYKQPFSDYIEAHNRVLQYYETASDSKNITNWLSKVVNAEKQGGPDRTDRTRYLAAAASRKLALPTLENFKGIELTIPLKSSLAAKKKAMNKALDAYKNLMDYRIAEFTTESTYQIAEVYNHFSVALMQSQRPTDLSEEELEQYEILLEEQAYPFEEKSIDIHGANAKRTSKGVYDEWVKLSLEALSRLQPVRYAKTEKIELYTNAEYQN